MAAHAPRTANLITAATIGASGSTAWTVVQQDLEIQPGQTLLVTPATGSVGRIVAQLAKKRGARVVGAGRAENLSELAEIGCDEVIVMPPQSGGYGGGVRVDAAFESIGGGNLRSTYPLILRGGRLSSAVDVPDQEEAERLGITAVRTRGRPVDGALDALAAMVDEGSLKLKVGHVGTLADTPRLALDVNNGIYRGKVVMTTGAAID